MLTHPFRLLPSSSSGRFPCTAQLTSFPSNSSPAGSVLESFGFSAPSSRWVCSQSSRGGRLSFERPSTYILTCQDLGPSRLLAQQSTRRRTLQAVGISPLENQRRWMKRESRILRGSLQSIPMSLTISALFAELSVVTSYK